MSLHEDTRGWVSSDEAGDTWHLLLGDEDDGPEVWRSSRDHLWRVRFWRGEICVMAAGPCARKVDAQELALAELEGAGMMPRQRERPGRRHDPATLAKQNSTRLVPPSEAPQLSVASTS